MRKVLIIDDEPSIAAFMAALVESELGFAPVVACSAETALECVSSFDYDLVISDTLSFRPDRPAEKGGDRWRWLDYLHSQIQAKNPNVPVLMMTAFPAYIYQDYAAHGLKGFIAKPFNLHEAITEILEALTSGPNFDQRDHPFRLTSLIARKAAAALRLDQPTQISQLAV